MSRRKSFKQVYARLLQLTIQNRQATTNKVNRVRCTSFVAKFPKVKRDLMNRKSTNFQEQGVSFTVSKLNSLSNKFFVYQQISFLYGLVLRTLLQK